MDDQKLESKATINIDLAGLDLGTKQKLNTMLRQSYQYLSSKVGNNRSNIPLQAGATLDEDMVINQKEASMKLKHTKSVEN